MKGIDDAVRNQALLLSLEWGVNFGKPIYDRLIEAHPALTKKIVAQLEIECRDVKHLAWRLYEDELDQLITTEKVRETLIQKYPWISADNLNNLENQGMYFARK